MGFLSKAITGSAGKIDSMTGNRGRNFLLGDQAGQAAEAAKLAQMFKAQQDRARSDLMGVLAERPEYSSVINSPEFQKMSGFAFGNEADPGFAMQRQREAGNLSDALQQSTLSQGGQQANAYSQLAMGGGLSGGARERIAAGGASSGILARQGLRGQNAKNLMDLGIAEEGQRYGAKQGVLQNQMQDKTNANQYAQQNWQTRANTIAGLSQAEGQQTAALATRQKDNGACCFIFMEADALSPVVRRYRDEHMTEMNRRGYYKLSEVLVPYMRHSRLVKAIVQATMTAPLTSYGHWHYTRRGIGFIFKPVKNFWMKAFDFLGGEHEFKRDNGETI